MNNYKKRKILIKMKQKNYKELLKYKNKIYKIFKNNKLSFKNKIILSQKIPNNIKS